MSSAVMSVRLSKQTKERLEQLAKVLHRSKSFLAGEAISTYLQMQEWQINEINNGIKEAEQGHLIDHDDVLTHWEQKKRADSLDHRRKS